jgi:ubiquinone/menaquinone biosynthesis C-methylase UbiE/uncharacterized protein YbaR (Trm112 family)
MCKNYLNYVCCPDCKNNLILEGNFLICKKCNKNYEVSNGIPVLIDRNKLNKHLIYQIEYFEHDMNDMFNQYELEEWQKNYLKSFLNNCSGLKNKLVLDCGTGSGYMSIELAKLGVSVIACDLTLKNLIKLKKIAHNLNLLNKIIFICCSAEELPFKNNIFDYLISNAVLEHLLKEREAIAEINRVCKNTSELMITVPLSFKYTNPIFLPINIIHDKRIGHLRRYNENILITKFSGFKLIKTYYTGHSKKVFKILLNNLLGKKLFNEHRIEQEERKVEDVKLFASNIICFFKK